MENKFVEKLMKIAENLSEALKRGNLSVHVSEENVVSIVKYICWALVMVTALKYSNMHQT
ncbi:MAG: hypothetical protein V3G42_10890 [Oscillospiraceae bacterium]